MRIAVINWTNRKAGGVENYLESVIGELSRLGHCVAFWHETAEPSLREPIALPDAAPSWSVAELGALRALSALREWQPDLIYAHGLTDPSLEAETIRLAPSVFLAHAYYGACISGAKTFKSPVVKPCARPFGWQCLLHYYPHRCGGLSPLSMWSNFRLQAKRLKLLRSYDAVVTLSEHMRLEYLKYGIAAEHAFDISADMPQALPPPHLNEDEALESKARDFGRLLFVGRMDFLKGGHVFLEALPRVYAALNYPLRVTFAGDGPERAKWEAQAARVEEQLPHVKIGFTGWVGKERLDELLGDCDLLVLPSLWPEPFGLIGPEAGLRGVPVAAFAAGGILDWLSDGVNGHLAPGDPPTAEGLAQSIIKCLHDPEVYLRLSRGAKELAQRFKTENHLLVLSEVFSRVVERRR